MRTGKKSITTVSVGSAGGWADGAGGGVQVWNVQVSGLDADLDLRRILSAVKKLFSCNGSIQVDTEYVHGAGGRGLLRARVGGMGVFLHALCRHGEVIQLQGDQRKNMEDWLYKEEIYIRSEGRIVTHGF
jgi:translation initiation factor 1 (eIF-1/SUI1)